MKYVTIDQLIAHCKADAEDTNNLVIYGEAAEAACEAACNRYFYLDQGAYDDAVATLPAFMSAAHTAYDTAIAAADAMTDEEDKLVAKDIAVSQLLRARHAMRMTLNGLIVTDDIIAAILLTAGNFYRNREENVTGLNSGAVALPWGAATILKRHWNESHELGIR